MRKLFKDPDSWVRDAIIWHQVIPEDLALEILNSDDVGAKHNLACNIRVPRSILEQLAKDSHQYTRQAANYTLRRIGSGGYT